MTTMTPLKWVVLFVLLFMDCLLNWFPLLGSFFQSMSARAHWNRVDHQRFFWWAADFIDAIFFWQPEHCKTQAEREARYGCAWGAYLAMVRWQ